MKNGYVFGAISVIVVVLALALFATMVERSSQIGTGATSQSDAQRADPSAGSSSVR